MDFNVKVYYILDLFGQEVWITQTIVNAWIIMVILIIIAIVIRFTMRKWKTIPEGSQNVVETLIGMFDNVVKDTAGEKFTEVGNWYFMVFCFLMMSSICSMVGLRPPTADWSTTFAFAMATVIIIQIMGLKHRKSKYLKSFIEPHFLFLPLNLIGELSRPISLSFRLFGNMLAGMILMTLVYELLPIYLRFFFPAALHAYFDIITGLLQAYIFCILSLSFISDAASAD